MASSRNKLWITLAAVVGYGGWAFYSSVYDGTMERYFDVALRAGVIQGAYAGLLTLVNLSVLEFLFLKFNSLLPCLVNIFVTVLSATFVQYLIIVPIHLVNGTPNIVLTLAPGIVIGTAFSTAYLFSVKKKYYPSS